MAPATGAKKQKKKWSKGKGTLDMMLLRLDLGVH
jgi:hypothetical protein